MTWTKLSDDHFDRPAVFGLSRSASLMHVEALVWCNRLLTDGHVPAPMLPRFTTSTDPETDAAALVDAGLWTPTTGGWQIEWEHQRHKVDVEQDRAENRERQQRYRERRKAARNGATNDGSNAVTNSGSNGRPTQPVPTPRRDCVGEGTGPDATASGRPSPQQPRKVGPDKWIVDMDLPA